MKLSEEQINELCDTAVEAGKEILKVYANKELFGKTTIKDNDSPLTLADTLSNDVIVKKLLSFSYQAPIISEENKAIAYEQRKSWKQFWLVDPLDGTKEFIKRNDEFTVNIALIENGVPVFGIIYIPVWDVLYVGTVNQGAYKIEKGIKSKITTRIHSGDVTAVGSSSHATQEEEEMKTRYNVKNFLAVGSSIKFCMVAEGKADIYYRNGPTMEWDTAAGEAILAAAGGKVTHKQNTGDNYNKENLLNGSFFCSGNPELLIEF